VSPGSSFYEQTPRFHSRLVFFHNPCAAPSCFVRPFPNRLQSVCNSVLCYRNLLGDWRKLENWSICVPSLKSIWHPTVEGASNFINICKLRCLIHVVVHVNGARLCLWTAATNRHIIHHRWYMSMKSYGGTILTGEIEELGKRPAPLCPPQIAHSTLNKYQQIYCCNGEVWCSLWGTDWILKYYLDELRFQRV
jgi:hypothetical protein